MSTVQPDHRLRADAARNRQRILDAARVAFASRGLNVSMDEIARVAHVGVGTVYRRFADKEELIEALFDDELDQLADLARRASEIEDPWEALSTFIASMVGRQSLDRGLKELLLGGEHGRERIARKRELMGPLIAAMVARAQASGQLRNDVDASDFSLMQIALAAIGDYTRDVNPDAWCRCLTLLIDGLKQRDGLTQMPTGPLDAAQADCAMRAWRPICR
jgi:AcrR family transcriptional regulator